MPLGLKLNLKTLIARLILWLLKEILDEIDGDGATAAGE